jgi:E3 ubiquitin-protein ligase TRIP12
MEKLPDLYRQYFLKEGVVHAMDQLAATRSQPEQQEAQGPAAASDEQGATADAQTASPGGRGRRASGAARPASRAGDKDDGEAAAARAEPRTPAGDTLRRALGSRARRFHAHYFVDGQGHALGEHKTGGGTSLVLLGSPPTATESCA